MMGKSTRILIAVILLLSLVLLGWEEVAWAANPGSHPSASLSARQPVGLQHRKHCDWERGTPLKRCKDDDDDDGSVKPPPDIIKTCERGTFSVGGIVTLEVKNLRKHTCLNADTRPYDPDVDRIPPNIGTILTDLLNLNIPPRTTKVQICFAVPPGEQVKIYASTDGFWKPLKTKVKNGLACAEVSSSGRFALIGK